MQLLVTSSSDVDRRKLTGRAQPAAAPPKAGSKPLFRWSSGGKATAVFMLSLKATITS